MDQINPVVENPETLNQVAIPKTPQTRNPLVLILSVLLIVSIGIGGLFYFQIQKLSKELSKYQSATPTPSATSIATTKVDCTDPRPEMCTQECIQNPPYICGSDRKSYCSTCQACSDTNVAWYEIKTSACGEGQFCGGIAGVACPEDFSCKYEGNYPDAGGVCTKN